MESDRDRRKLKAREASEKAQAASSLSKALNRALAKEPNERTSAELSLIRDNPALATSLQAKIDLRRQKREEAEARSAEVEDAHEELELKLQRLCHLIKEAAANKDKGSLGSKGRTLTPERISFHPEDQQDLDPKHEAQELDGTRSSHLSQNGHSFVAKTTKSDDCKDVLEKSEAADGKQPCPKKDTRGIMPAPKQQPLKEEGNPQPPPSNEAIENSDDSSKDQDLAQQARDTEGGTGGGVVVHTGAGLSTTAGIPDFRGPKGVWTLQSKGQQTDHCMGLSYERVGPTPGHMVLAAMVRHGLVKHIVTQNVDGLHLRSGVPKESHSELHGCVFREQCKSCGKKFLRSFDVTVPQGSAYHRHKTGRLCGQDPERTEASNDSGERKGSPVSSDCHSPGTAQDEDQSQTSNQDGAIKDEAQTSERNGDLCGSGGGCGGILNDTIVHFGEMLDPDELNTATAQSTGADLALCLGSSFKVPPANKLPRLARQLVIVNLQWTPLDKFATLKINGRLDAVLGRAAEILGVPWGGYNPTVDPLLGKRFLRLQECNLPASTLFMRKPPSVSTEANASADKKAKKRRKSPFGTSKGPKRISFPRASTK